MFLFADFDLDPSKMGGDRHFGRHNLFDFCCFLANRWDDDQGVHRVFILPPARNKWVLQRRCVLYDNRHQWTGPGLEDGKARDPSSSPSNIVHCIIYYKSFPLTICGILFILQIIIINPRIRENESDLLCCECVEILLIAQSTKHEFASEIGKYHDFYKAREAIILKYLSPSIFFS